MHIFSSKNKIPVYHDKYLTRVVGFLRKGEWIGVVDENDDYFIVVSTDFAGWVRREDCISGNPQNIYIQLISGKPHYVNSEIN